MMINLGVFTCNIESLGFFILCNAEQQFNGLKLGLV